MKKSLFIIAIFIQCIFAVNCFSDEDYVIGDGDGLSISVWGESQLNVQVTVRPDGKITMPAIGDVTASGYTPKRLSETLNEKMQDFVKKPIVTVSVMQITNNKIYVLGGGVLPGGANTNEGMPAGSSKSQMLSVMYSGVYNLPGRTTLLKFLSGVNMLANADLEQAYILRGGKKIDVDFYDLFIKADISKDIPLKAEDIIYLPSNEHNKIYVMGAVGTPKMVAYRKGIRILDIILDAGGFSKFASENNVLVLRKQGDKDSMKEIVVKAKNLMKDGDLSQNIPMMPGDFVIVKESIF